MRVAFVVGGFPKLSETWILSQVTSLVDRGHEVDIYARRNPREPAAHRDVDAYGLRARTHYYELPASRAARAGRALRALAPLLLRHPRAAAACLSLRRYRSLYAVLNNVIFVAPLARRRYDAVLCHFGGNGLDFAAFKVAFPGTRFLTMFHGDDYFLADEQGPDALSLLRDVGDAFLVTTDCFGRATLRRQGFDERRIVTLRLSIAAKRIPFRERSAPGDPVRILSVGRLVEKKGLDTGIRAVAALRAAAPHLRVRYTVIGDGPLRASLEALVRDLGAADVVDLAGPRDGAGVMRAMREADLYLLPSVMEQAGYVLLEAQAAGLPVVATRVGGVPEMVREGESAVLVAPGDPAAMTAALARVLAEPERWAGMGRAGRRHVEDQHDVDQVAPQLERLLRG